ncbi:hypothetical protein, partial [Tsukamurella pulmonis]|uniref:hypothetical protein n=1 Tax=Tsukamurella pulmonis TaxID=47312 RepID=UPI001A9DE54E
RRRGGGRCERGGRSREGTDGHGACCEGTASGGGTSAGLRLKSVFRHEAILLSFFPTADRVS